jgi:hypothetical protein
MGALVKRESALVKKGDAQTKSVIPLGKSGSALAKKVILEA